MWNCYSCFFRIMSICNNWIKKNIIVSIIFFSIYLINRFINIYTNNNFINILFDYYLNDYIGGFLFCSYINVVLIIFHKKPITKFKILFPIMIVVSIMWEYLFPIFLKYSTSDFYDVVAYLLGTCTYYLLLCYKTNLMMKRGTDEEKIFI